MKSFILFAAAATALSAAPAALASDPEAVITYEQSQLGSARGVAELRYEIREAAEGVCLAPANPTYAERRAQAECVEAAIASAEEQLQQKLADAGLRRFAENRVIRIAAAR